MYEGKALENNRTLHGKLYLYCIAYGCPKLNRNRECPIWCIDDLTFEEKIEFINQLNDDEIDQIIDYHLVCTIRT